MDEKPTYEELEKRVKEFEKDAIDRKKSEDAWMASEQLHTLLQSIQTGIVIHGPDTKIIKCNKMSQELLGLTEDQMLGKKSSDPSWKFFNENGSNMSLENYPVNQVMATKNVLKGFIIGVYRPNKNDVVSILVNAVPVIDHVGNISQVIATFMDITDHKQAVDKLKESEATFKKLFDLSPLPISVTDMETGKIIDVNTKLCELTEHTRETLLGRQAMELGFYSEHNRERFIRELSISGEVKGMEMNFKASNGFIFDMLMFATSIQFENKRCILTTLYDLTEQKHIEAKLQQAQKMEAIGTLAGGIAHDFNNILSIILGNTELAIDDVPEWNPARHNLEEVIKASLRAKDVVQQLLSFSRKSDQKQKPVNISPIIKDCLKFLRSSIPTSIDIHGTIPDESCIVLADPTQVHQVMMNLCTNAAHAMSENGGILEVSLSVVEIGKNETIKDIELNQGQYVKITVSDTGHGIAKENIDRIFDPYFTTKEIGEGSGIGLSVVHGIVKSHHGSISVDSEYGKGTTFNVFLPVVEKEPASEEETDTAIPTGNERILFVDDENSIANMTSQMLERLGYIVTARTSSTDALETFRAQPDNFDLIISDMSMPGITGDKLAKELQRIKPDIPIILCTGFSERIDDEKAKSIGVQALVMKPIIKSVLAKTIRKVLD